MPTTITSRENERVKYARRLAGEGAFRASEGLLFAEGVRLCADLAATLPVAAVFCTEGLLPTLPPPLAAAEELYQVGEGVAEKLAGTKTPQGLFCLFRLPGWGFEDLDAEKGILLCEALQDPANVGAVVRSAAGLGFGGVVLTAGCADPTGPKALRASMGAVGRIPVVHGLPLQQAVGRLRQAGCTLYAAALEGAAPVGEAVVDGPFALMIGNEGAGLTQAALAVADRRVFVPMARGVESLNAAAAASVLMYALRR